MNVFATSCVSAFCLSFAFGQSAFAIDTNAIFNCEINVPNGAWPDNHFKRIDRFSFVPQLGANAAWERFVNFPGSTSEQLAVERVQNSDCPRRLPKSISCAVVTLIDAAPIDGMPRWHFKVELADDQHDSATVLGVSMESYLPGSPLGWQKFGTKKPSVCIKTPF
jgi:hypothetical protein